MPKISRVVDLTNVNKRHKEIVFRTSKCDALHLEIDTGITAEPDATVELYIKKPNGKVVSQVCTMNDTVATVDVLNGAVDIAGLAEGIVKITDSEGEYCAPTFHFAILDSFAHEDSIINSVGVSVIEEIKKDLASIKLKAASPKYIHKYFGGNIMTNESITVDDMKLAVDRAVEVGYNSFFIAFYHKYYPDTGVTNQLPTDDTIKQIIAHCQSKNPKFLALKTHVSPNSGNWADNDAYLRNTFKGIVTHVANICAETGVKNIFISNEQPNLTSIDRDVWQEIINGCHALGLKCYSSFVNFKEFQTCVFSDLLDGMGINYYPVAVTSQSEVTKEGVRESIGNIDSKQYLYMYKQMKKIIGKDVPIFISEIGCCNNVDSLAFPGAWDFDDNNAVKEEYQAYYYNAFLSEMGTQDIGIDGIFTWSLGKSKNRNTTQFSPLWNEQCEEVIKYYVRGEE